MVNLSKGLKKVNCFKTTKKLASKNRLFSILFLWTLSSTANCQILNVEGLRIITDTSGWSGTIGTAVSASKSTKSLFIFNSNGHVQFKQARNLFLFVGHLNLIDVNHESFNKSGFAHFRYNRKISNLVRLEAFTQIQFNALTKIESRILNGLGIRFKISQNEKAKLYSGVTYMYEYEKLKTPEIIHNDHRLSSYLTFTLAPEKTFSLSNTTYYQPIIGLIKDFRVSNDFLLSFKITKHLSLSASFHYLYDSKPPLDVPKINYQLYNGLNYKF